MEKAKTLENTDASGATKNVKDIKFWGNGDTWKLISKASSQEEGWMKSTKAMPIRDIGVVLQVSTQQHNQVAEAIVLIPMASIVENIDNEGAVVSREIINLDDEIGSVVQQKIKL